MKRALAAFVLIAFGCGGRSIRHGSTGDDDADSGGTSIGNGAQTSSGGSTASSGGSGGNAASTSSGGSGTSMAGCGDIQNDALNCGQCGHACGESCAYGHCVWRVVEQQPNVGCVATDGVYAYWATADLDQRVGTVWRAVRGGGPPVMLATGLEPLWPCKIALDSANLYITSEFDSQVIEVPLYDALPHAIAKGKYVPKAVGLSWTNVYFAESYGAIRSVPVNGGAITTLADEGGALEGFALDDMSAFWTTRDGMAITGRLLSVPLEGGEVTTLATNVPTGEGMALDGDYVYWLDYSGGQVFRTPKWGGPVERIVANLSLPRALACDGASLFIGGLGGVFRVPTTGGEAALVASGGTVQDLAVDETGLVFTNGTDVFEVSLL